MGKTFRLISPRAFAMLIVSILSITTLGAEPRYWTEVLDKRRCSVGTSDGVTVAVSLRASTVIDVEVIAFNDTNKNVKIVSSRIRPLAVRSNGVKSRWVPLRRSEFQAGYGSQALIPFQPTSGVFSDATLLSGTRGTGSPVLDRVARAFETADSPPRNDYEPSKEKVVGSKPGSGSAYGRVTSSTRYAPVRVRPGGYGKQSIAFERRPADWYEVEVSVAGREFRFKFVLPRPDQAQTPANLP